MPKVAQHKATEGYCKLALAYYNLQMKSKN